MADQFVASESHAARPGEVPAPKKGSGFIWLVVLVVLGGGGYFLWRSSHKAQTAAAAQGDAGAARRGAPVTVIPAGMRDLPVYMEGLGSVEAYNTVTVKSRVDGELMSVHFKEGQEVHKGDLLAEIDPRPYQVALAQAQANLSRDQAQLADAKLDADRYSQLVKEGIIAQQQYDTQHALAGQVEGSTAADQAQIDNAKLNMVYSRITSPIDGRVGLRLVDAGNIVHASDANGLLVITQMQPISVIFTLPEDSLPAVNNKMRAGGQLQVKALSRDDGTELATGSLLTIDNQIDQTTGTFRLKAVFSNQDRALWPNQFVNVRLMLDLRKNAIIIPSAAIQRGNQGTFVYVVKSDNTAEVRPVTVALAQGNISVIEKGVSAGEMVVTDGQDRLRDGAAVEARQDGQRGGGQGARGGQGAGGGQGGGGQGGGRQRPGGGDAGANAGANPGANPSANTVANPGANGGQQASGQRGQGQAGQGGGQGQGGYKKRRQQGDSAPQSGTP